MRIYVTHIYVTSQLLFPTSSRNPQHFASVLHVLSLLVFVRVQLVLHVKIPNKILKWVSFFAGTLLRIVGMLLSANLRTFAFNFSVVCEIDSSELFYLFLESLIHPTISLPVSSYPFLFMFPNERHLKFRSQSSNLPFEVPFYLL